MAVAAGLIEMTSPGGSGVGDRCGLGHAYAQHAAARAAGPGSDAHEDPGGAGAHEMQCGPVTCASAGEHRHVERANEGLEVERLDSG